MAQRPHLVAIPAPKYTVEGRLRPSTDAFRPATVGGCEMSTSKHDQAPTSTRLRRWAPGMIALGLLSAAAFGTQAVAHAAEPTAAEAASAQCQNLSVGWDQGIKIDPSSGQAQVAKVTVTGAGQGCVGLTFTVQLQDGSATLGSGTANVSHANAPVVVNLDHPVDVAGVDSVSVTAR